MSEGQGEAGGRDRGGAGGRDWGGARGRDRAGASGPVQLASVVDRDVTVAEVAALVEDDAAGAVVTFAGVVRDHDGGRGVLRLDYEAHPSASSVIAAVAESIAGEHPGVRIAVLHRVGSLGIGDVALVAAVSAAHRAEAFTACGALVDRIKDDVPIWKHQRFDDGTDEWVAAL